MGADIGAGSPPSYRPPDRPHDFHHAYVAGALKRHGVVQGTDRFPADRHATITRSPTLSNFPGARDDEDRPPDPSTLVRGDVGDAGHGDAGFGLTEITQVLVIGVEVD